MKSISGATISVLLAAAAPAIAADGASSFAGHWHVAGVAVSDAGVQALSDNNPSLMGKGLTFTSKRLSWGRPTATNDTCVNPVFTRSPARPSAELRALLGKLGMHQPVAYALRCGSGSWGPEGGTTIYRGAAGAVAMPWYDGGLLKLAR